jgi:addiction module RelB/DinJ family antitoxin
MNTAIVNVKVDPKIKKQAQKVAQTLGFSLSSLINAYLRQFVRDRTVGFSDVRLELTPYAKRMLKESEAEIHSGKVKSYSPDEYLAYLDTMIANDKKHRKSNSNSKVRKIIR